MANGAGVFGIAVHTDLLCGEEQLQALVDLEVDAVCAHINADSEGVYEKAMGIGGAGGFEKVQDNIIWLLKRRKECMAAAISSGDSQVFIPWVVPHLTKTVDTLVDMEGFFDRWMHFANQAVILGSQQGRGNDGALMQELSPVRMAPPRRFGCRQLDRRMTVHSDGKVALCDQDWLGDGSVGDAGGEALCELWKRVRVVGKAHCEGNYEGICGGCNEWHRP